MGRISDEDIERVRAASDFVAIASENVQLKRQGRKYVACCPFHQEKTPSFQIDPELQLWHCFGCGEGGDIFDYVARIHQLDFPDAVRFLADRAHIEITEVEGGKPRPKGEKERLSEACAQAEAFYHRELMRSPSKDAAAARAYLSKRGFGSGVCKRWGLGYAPGHSALVEFLSQQGFSRDEMVSANLALKTDGGAVRDRFFDRIMFPIHDQIGKTIAFGGRVVGKTPPNTGKYINTGDTPIFRKSNHLYGLDKAKASITSEAGAIVVEGYTDVIALSEAGVKNVVAALGTALTQQHVRTLRNLNPRRITYLFDGDSAGQKAADRAVQFIEWGIASDSRTSSIDFQVAVLPDDADPADYVSAHGKEGIDAVIASGKPLIRFAIDRRLSGYDLNSTGQRNAAMHEAVALLAPIKGTLIANDYANYIADALLTDPQIVQRALNAAKPPSTGRRDASADASAAPGASQGAGAASVPAASHEESDAARMQRELLVLLVRFPEVRAESQKACSTVPWEEGIPKQAADAVFAAPEGLADVALVSELEKTVPGAGAYLASATIDADNPDKARGLIRMLIIQTREADLEKRIRSATVRLKNQGDLSSEEYDSLFRQTTQLQKELKELRDAQIGQ